MKTSKLLKWGLPFFITLTLAPFTPYLDLFISNLFYIDENFSSHIFFRFFYKYGVYPAFLVGILSLLFFLTSFFKKELQKYRLSLLFLSLAFLCGPGILINGILKGFLSRPRPVQITAFGGIEPFSPFYNLSLSFPNKFKSFPSGHSTMGFYFFNLIFLGQRLKNSSLTLFGVWSSIVLGFCMSISRIAQGGHFFSDTLLSLCLIWYLGLFCDWLIFEYVAKKSSIRYIKD
ncbi:MAG: hypothetical protein S4CHLAM7_15080 [Chlamydiae bacterium]|nr:hypothetical protein [Chlamydiota bacterium]